MSLLSVDEKASIGSYFYLTVLYFYWLQFYSDNPAISLSPASISEQEPTRLKVSVRASSWNYPSDEAPISINVTIYSSLSPQTHMLKVTLLTDRRTRLSKLPRT